MGIVVGGATCLPPSAEPLIPDADELHGDIELTTESLSPVSIIRVRSKGHKLLIRPLWVTFEGEHGMDFSI